MILILPMAMQNINFYAQIKNKPMPKPNGSGEIKLREWLEQMLKRFRAASQGPGLLKIHEFQ